MLNLWLKSNLSLEELSKRLHALRKRNGKEILFDPKFQVAKAEKFFGWRFSDALSIVLLSMTEEELSEELPRIAKDMVKTFGKTLAKTKVELGFGDRKREIFKTLIGLINGINDPGDEAKKLKAEREGLRACGISPKRFSRDLDLSK